MRTPLHQRSWSPHLVGAGIGILSWFAFLTADHPLGITTAFENTVALAASSVGPSLAESHSYFVDQSPQIGWEWMLVLGKLPVRRGE